MKKLFFFITILLIVVILFFFSIKNIFNVKKIINLLENETDLIFILADKDKWIYYPTLSYSNKITVKDQSNFFTLKNADLNIKKNYFPSSNINIKLIAPSIKIQGVEFRKTNIDSYYNNKNIYFNEISGKLIEGNFQSTGKINLTNQMPFKINGSFENISLNMLLNQLKIAKWERVNIKISSSNFTLTGNAKNNEFLYKNLRGNIPIKGSIFFVSTEEERFAGALLSLLIDKLPNLKTVSNSLNFLLNNFSNIPSVIDGKLIITDNYISTENLIIKNDYGLAKITGTHDLMTNIINGKIIFFKEDQEYLNTTIKGNIKSPQILISDKLNSIDNQEIPTDLKKLFEEGIHSFVNKLLKIDD